MAIAIPFTFALDTLPAIAFLVGVNKGELVGGAIPAVLMNKPGTPDAAATAFDGHPLARRGQPPKATKMALYASTTGDTFSDLALISISVPIAAAFMSHAAARRASDDPDSFGKGNLHGIAAAESANSSVVGANMIPLLTLGIPGSVSAALIISAFMIHGIRPGPLLFEQQGRLIYSLFGAMIVANVVNLLAGQLGLRFWSRVVKAPESVIFSSAILLCIVGVSLSTGGLFGVVVMLVFAGLGYLMTAFCFSVVIFIIAFFLGGRFEMSLSQSLVLLDGDPLALAGYPVALLLGLALASVWVLGVKPALATRAGEDRK